MSRTTSTTVIYKSAIICRRKLETRGDAVIVGLGAARCSFELARQVCLWGSRLGHQDTNRFAA